MIPPEYVDQIKARVALSQVLGKDIALRRAGSEWTALCPFHPERSPSFFVNDSKGFFHCFGCGANGDAITWYTRHHSMTFEHAVEALAGEKPPTAASAFEANLRARGQEHAARKTIYPLNDDQRGQQAKAGAIWRAAKPISGTLGETYLRSRGITSRNWPPCLRFVDRAWHGWERTGHPALIGAVQDQAGVTAIQTIFLKPDGTSKAGVTPSKPVTGPMVDGAVRLAAPGPVLGIAEGIETAMSARQIFSLPVWATLGASRLGAVRLPEGVQQVIIFADNGARGKAEAWKAIPKYEDQGAAAIIEYPSAEFDDFNSMLQHQMRAA